MDNDCNSQPRPSNASPGSSRVRHIQACLSLALQHNCFNRLSKKSLVLGACLLSLLYLYGKESWNSERGAAGTENESYKDSVGFNMTRELMRRNPGVFSTIPRQTLSNYKNPCWLEEVQEEEQHLNPYRNTYYTHQMIRLNLLAMKFEDRLIYNGRVHLRLRCMPYFYIIGMPKCGTTDLYYRLAKHPDVAIGLIKEPHWWTRYRLGGRIGVLNNSSCPIRDYLDLFDEAASTIRTTNRNRLRFTGQGTFQHNVITGEGSASTMWDNRWWRQEFWITANDEPPILVANLLRAVQPHARIIITLRNPTDRLYSEYFSVYPGKNKSVEDFNNEVVIAIDMFNNCLKNNSVRACSYEPSISAIPVRLRLGLYAVYLHDWFSIFPQEQILVQRLEDRSKDPRTTMTKVFNFLRLEGYNGTGEKYNIFDLKKRNSRRESHLRLGQMLPKTWKILNDFYRPYNYRLASLLDDERFLWLNNSSV